MSYSGENRYFSFRDGFCEPISGISFSSAAIAELGRVLAKLFRRFSVSCDSFRQLPTVYALCSGISECGKDVYVCENTDLPSFLFGYPRLSADCGIYAGGENGLKISFFGEDGFPVTDMILSRIMNDPPMPPSEKCGRIAPITSFRSIYIDNIADSLGKVNASIPAGISCGSRSVRSLWLEFFTGDDDELIFQISDDGQHVNAYSTEFGFISYDKLVLAYALKLSENGLTICLPENMHYAADLLSENHKMKLRRFSPEKNIPKEAAGQRFLHDPLYMCTHLASDRRCFREAIKALPSMASAKREITVDEMDAIPCGKTIIDNGGRVIISQSGKNRVRLTAQALSAETAAELCAGWIERLSRRHTSD